jgi:CP family cyanate transporter-like MFS transporter
VAGLLGTIPVLCMGVFAPAAAPLAGRAGLRNMIIASVAAVALFGLARAAAPGAPLVLLLTLPVGIGMAIAGALLPVAVKERFPDRPAFANGVCTSGLNGGAAVASLIAVPAADAFGGWRGALTLFSLAAVVQCAGWMALSRGAWMDRTEESARLPVRRPVVWMIVTVFALQSVVYYGLTTWVAAAFQEYGWSAGSAGALVAVFGFSTVPGGLLIPWLADRLGSRRRWLVGLTATVVLATFGFAAAPDAGFLWAAIAGGAIGAVFPLCLAMCLDVAHEPVAAGAAAALMLLGGYLVAGLAPFGLGAVRDLTGSFSASLWALFGTALLLVAACLPLTATRLRPA